MSHLDDRLNRFLSIDFCNRGVGFVVFEGFEHLIDWGVKGVATVDKRKDRELAHIKALIHHYGPHVLITEDMDAPGCRRRGRAVTLTRTACELAQATNMAVHKVSCAAVKKAFKEHGAHTKVQIAAAVALRYSALIRHLPPLRKPWMSEDYRFSIFDAAAFLITHLRDGNSIDFPFDS